MSWYYVDAAGQTQGPFEVSVMKQKYSSKACTEESYIWNGTSVNQWTPLKQVPELLNQVKVSQPAAPSSRPARRRGGPLGGGGRKNLLAAISRGAQLKKVDEKDKKDNSSAVGGSSGGGGGAKKAGGFGGGMDLMSQLKAKQAQRKAGGGGGGGGGGWSKPKSSAPKTSSAPKSSPSPARKWGAVNTGGSSGSSSGSLKSRKDAIKKKIDNLGSSDWQFKAIEKILG